MAPEKQQQTPQRRSSLKKYYQVWEGRNVLCCKGKFMIGSLFLQPVASTQPVVYSSVLINVPAFLEEFLVFRFFNGATFVGILIPFIVLHILGNYFMFKTILTDPGIIRRANTEYVESEELSHIPRKKTISKRNPCEITLNNHLMKLKYCQTCHIYRPIRTSHCHECDNCVERFDHHCPWLGACIGKRNYTNFFLFVLTNTALDMFAFFASLYRMLTAIDELSSTEDFGDYLKQEPYTLISMIYCFLFFFFLAPLLLFHIWLIHTNQTTNEFWKETWKRAGANPYNRKSFISNCKNILCLPARASFIRLRNAVYPNYDHRPSAESSILNKVDAETPNTNIENKKKPEQIQFSLTPVLKRGESDKSNTPTNYGNQDSKEENDMILNSDLGRAQPLNGNIISPKLEPPRIYTPSGTKDPKTPELTINNFVFKVDGDSNDSPTKEFPQEPVLSVGVKEDLDNEKSPLSGILGPTNSKLEKRNKIKKSGSIHDPPDKSISRVGSAKRSPLAG